MSGEFGGQFPIVSNPFSVKIKSLKGSNYVQVRYLAAIFRPKTFPAVDYLAKSANI